MIILDTDHFTVLQITASERRNRLRACMARSWDQDFAVSAITLEEQTRGWLAEIAGSTDFRKQVGPYARLVELVRFFSAWPILPFDDAAAARGLSLRQARVRIGTMDLKIAATALAHDALLLTANSRHFSLVPGLRQENWLR